MFLLRSLLFTNRDYYSTLLRIVIVTDWQVIEMDAQKRIRKLTEEQRILFSRWSPLTEEQKRLHGCEPPFVGGFFQAAIHPINKLSDGLN